MARNPEKDETFLNLYIGYISKRRYICTIIYNIYFVLPNF